MSYIPEATATDWLWFGNDQTSLVSSKLIQHLPFKFGSDAIWVESIPSLNSKYSTEHHSYLY